MANKIIVSMIVKNEEAHLQKCLESIKDADDIIIVDTGSTDKTIEIANRYTKRVYTDYKWRDNFAEARNYALSKIPVSKNTWVLSIDADEYLEPNGIEKIRQRIVNEKKDIVEILMTDSSNGNVFYYPRLFRRKSEIHWVGAVHNYLNVADDNKSDIMIVFEYSSAHKKDPDRALRILKKEVMRDDKLVREKFYLGCGIMYRKDWTASIYWFEKYLKVAWWGPEWSYAYYLLAKCYNNISEWDKARDNCLQALKINANFKEPIKLLAELSGPKNRVRWLEFLQTATDEGVLFLSTPSEKSAEYYNKLFANNSDMSRYENIRTKIVEIVGNEKVLDIGCGTAELGKLIKNYHGFDFSEEAVKIANNPNVWKGDAYVKDNYRLSVDTYVALEVFEHLDDFKVIHNIPTDKKIIFSVPSFKDPSHIRTFTEETARIRYKHFINIEKIIRFVWNGLERKWTESKNTPEDLKNPDYILLCIGLRI